jgi:MFS family permease
MEGRSAVKRLALARFLSGTGSRLALIALAFLIFQKTGSPLWVAAVFFFNFGVIGFLTPLAGAIADRFDRRRVMLLSDGLGAACWSLYVVVRDPGALVALGFLASVFAMPFWSAQNAAVPNLVREDELGWANGTLAAAGNTASLLGPALGGAIYAVFGPWFAFAVNAGSFALSFVLVLSIRGVRFAEARETTAGGEPGTTRGVFRGFRLVFGDRVLRSLFLAWTMSFFGMNIAFVADPPLAAHFGVGAFGYGLIDAFFGAGALVGAIYARRVARYAELRWIAIGLGGVALGWFAIAAAPWFALVLGASLLAALVDAIGSVSVTNVIQRRSPDAVRGRVNAAFDTAGLFANAVGFLVVGPLVAWLGPQPVYFVGGVVMVASTLVFWLPVASVTPAAEPDIEPAIEPAAVPVVAPTDP